MGLIAQYLYHSFQLLALSVSRRTRTILEQQLPFSKFTWRILKVVGREAAAWSDRTTFCYEEILILVQQLVFQFKPDLALPQGDTVTGVEEAGNSCQ